MNNYSFTRQPEGAEERDEAIFQEIWNLVSSLVEYASKYDENHDRDKDYAFTFSETFKIYFKQLQLESTKEKVRSEFWEDINFQATVFTTDPSPDFKYQWRKRYKGLKNLMLPNLSDIFKDNDHQPVGGETENDENKFLSTFENNFDNTPKEEVYNFFKEKLVDKNHIDIETLKMYLTSAFDKKEPNKIFKLKKYRYKKDIIQSVFYAWYKNCRKNNTITKDQTKKDYSSLFLNYFIGFDSASDFR